MDTRAVICNPSPVRVWGLTPTDRLNRFLERKGILVADDVNHTDGARDVLILRGDHVYDDRLLDALIANPNVAMRSGEDDGAPVVAAHVPLGDAATPLDEMDGVPPSALAADARLALLKAETPFALEVTEANRRTIERRLYDSSYKGVTDVVTKWVWPTPARWSVGVCVQLGLRPNHVTILGFTLMLVALSLFTRGHYGWGLLAAWFMTFLDTVDGKLARTTLTSSRFGHWLDKLTDIVHPPFWYLAWAGGLAGAFDSPTPSISLAQTVWAIFAFYIGGRVVEGVASGVVKGGLFVWRPTDSFFRLFTARRNTCLVPLTVFCALGRPDLGLWSVAAWTAATTVFLLCRLILAWTVWRPSRRQLESWLLDVNPGAADAPLAVRWFAQRPRTGG